MVNGEGAPPVPRRVRRNLRAAIHNVEHGKGLKDGETLDHLHGLAAFVHMADPVEGRKLLELVAGVKGKA